MWAFILEAGFALFLLVFIVWWTMYSGQKPMQDQSMEQDQRAKRDDASAPPPRQ
jgi:hypothetical protein